MDLDGLEILYMGKEPFSSIYFDYSSDSTVGSCCTDAAGGDRAENAGERSCSGRKSSSSKSVWSAVARAAGISFNYNL